MLQNVSQNLPPASAKLSIAAANAKFSLLRKQKRHGFHESKFREICVICITTLQLHVFLARKFLRSKLKLQHVSFSEFEGGCHCVVALLCYSIRLGFGNLGDQSMCPKQAQEPRYTDGVLLAHDLGFLEHDEHDRLSESSSGIKRMLTAFCRKLKADSLRLGAAGS